MLPKVCRFKHDVVIRLCVKCTKFHRKICTASRIQLVKMSNFTFRFKTKQGCQVVIRSLLSFRL